MNKDTFISWKHSLETEEIFRYLSELRADRVDMLIELCAGAETLEKLIQAPKLAGMILAINDLLEIEYEDINIDKEIDND